MNYANLISNLKYKYIAITLVAFVTTLLLYFDFAPALAANGSTNINQDNIIKILNGIQMLIGIFTVILKLLIPDKNHDKIPWQWLLLLLLIYCIAGLIVSIINPWLFWIYTILSLISLNSNYFLFSCIFAIIYISSIFAIFPIKLANSISLGLILSIFLVGIVNFIFQNQIIKQIDKVQQHTKKLKRKFIIVFYMEKVANRVFRNQEIFGMIFITELLGSFFGLILKIFLF